MHSQTSKKQELKKVIKIQTRDGRLFDSEEKAFQHQSLLNEIERVYSLIPKDLREKVDRNEGYVQLTNTTLGKIKDSFKALFIEYHPEIYKEFFSKDERHKQAIGYPMGLIGRILDDYNSPLSKLNMWIACISSTNKLYQQPYFGIHDNGENVCLGEV